MLTSHSAEVSLEDSSMYLFLLLPCPERVSFPDDHGAAILANPDLVYSTRIHVDTGAGTERFLLTLRFLRVPESDLSINDEVRGQASMRMG